MSKQDFIDSVNLNQKMGECLQNGDIEGAKQVAARLFGTLGETFLNAAMSVKTPQELGDLIKSFARQIEQSGIAMARAARKRNIEATAEQEAAAAAANAAAQNAANQIKERETQLNTAIAERETLEKKIKETQKKHAEAKKHLAAERKQLEQKRKKAAQKEYADIDAKIEVVKQKEKALDDEMKMLKDNLESKKQEIKKRKEHLAELKRRQTNQQGDNTQETSSPQQTVAPRETSSMIQTMDGMDR